MKIFGVGLNKTGTTSLGFALEKLGYKGHVTADLDLVKSWKNKDLTSIFNVADKNEIFEDWPWPLLYKELAEKYPNAKFILTMRKTPEIWFNSLCKHALRTGPTEFRKIIYGSYMPHDFKEKHIEFYLSHNQSIIEYFEKENKNRLLELCFENGDGWLELCDFLEIEKTIEGSFPKLNIAKN